MANRNARIVWALLARQQIYDPHHIPRQFFECRAAIKPPSCRSTETFNAQWEPDYPIRESNKLMTKQAQTGASQIRRNYRTKFENVGLIGNHPTNFIKASDTNHDRTQRPNRYTQTDIFVISNRFTNHTRLSNTISEQILITRNSRRMNSMTNP